MYAVSGQRKPTLTHSVPNRQRIRVKKRKSCADYVFDTVILVVVIALLCHTVFNITVKNTVHEQLTKMKDSLCTLKDTIYSIDHAYDNLHDDLLMISQIKSLEDKTSNHDQEEINNINEKVKKFNEVKETVNDMGNTYDKNLREIYNRERDSRMGNLAATSPIHVDVSQSRDDRLSINRMHGSINLRLNEQVQPRRKFADTAN